MSVTISQFESPAGEYQSLNELNLHSLLVGEKEHALFFCLAEENNLRSIGIFCGDVLVANRAATARNGDVVIAVVDGSFVCRIFDKERSLLLCDSESISCSEDVIIKATVTASIRAHRSEFSAAEYPSFNELNLHSLVVGKKEHAVFFCMAEGNNLRSQGIFHGDVLVANRATTPDHGDVVISVVDGNLMCRFLDKECSLLLCDSESIPCDESVVIEATVTASVRAHRKLL